MSELRDLIATFFNYRRALREQRRDEDLRSESATSNTVRSSTISAAGWRLAAPTSSHSARRCLASILAIAIEALRDALDDRTSHVYSSAAGIELRRALAASLAALNGSVNPDTEIIITAGGNQAFQLALTTLIDPGDEVVLVSPHFLNHDGSVPSRPRQSRLQLQQRVRSGRPGTTLPLTSLPGRSRGLGVAQQSDRAPCCRRSSSVLRRSQPGELFVVVDETHLRFTADTDSATAVALTTWRENVVVVGQLLESICHHRLGDGYLLANASVISRRGHEDSGLHADLRVGSRAARRRRSARA